MGKSFVLKGLSGRPGGYVMQAPGTLRIRVQGIEGKKACLTAIYADGKERTFGVDCADGEIEKNDAGGTLFAAYVTVEGALVLHTGDAALSAFEKSRAHARMTHDLDEEKAQRAAAPTGVFHAEPLKRQPEKLEAEETDRQEKAGRAQEGKQDQCMQTEDNAAAQAIDTGIPSCLRGVSGENGRDKGGQADLGDPNLYCVRPAGLWPPPPCMPLARYVSGCWEEG